MGQYLLIGSVIIVTLIIVIIFLCIFKHKESKYYKNKIKDLEIERNVVASSPVLLELSKIEPIIKNDKMEEKYNKWHDRFINIRENRLPVIDDMLIDLDVYVEKHDYKVCNVSIAKIEIEIYKVRESVEKLLEEIRAVSLSEEKYRAIITKLKTKYRDLNKEYMDHKELYDSTQEAIEMQLDNIEKKFLDFETVMENNDYTEVVHIVKTLEATIDHMELIVNDVPDVLLMASHVIPKRMKEVKLSYDDMLGQGYPLDYLNIDYNIEETKKNINTILEKVNILNLEGSMFDLKTMLEYYDNIFLDFEKERLSRKVFEEVNKDFEEKIVKTNKLVNDVYKQLPDIKKMYDLSDEDIKIIYDVNKVLVVINDDYKKLLGKLETKGTPYSILNQEIEDLTVRLSQMEEDFDKALKSLGNMYDDEVRAREQLDEIQEFLKQCKVRMRSYKLPVITDTYFIQLSEANEAISEVIKELAKKPIAIQTLNTRVDTARDLVLKLYNTTNEMIKTAKLAEMSIVYGNRYRMFYDEIDKGLNDAERFFFNGNYKKSLDVSLKTTSIVDQDIYKKLLHIYDE